MINISKEIKNKIADIIHCYSGILLELIANRQFEKKISKQMANIGIFDINDYIFLLETYKENSKALDDLISELAISESFFFRNPNQFKYILNHFLFNKKWLFPIKIWSVGCSRGEEAYSIAMIMKSFQANNEQTSCSINAGDINQKNLQFAEQAIYSTNSLRDNLSEFEDNLEMKLGKLDKEGNCHVCKKIQNMVSFSKINLNDIQSLNCLKGSDIIFCRNVLIYFDSILREKLLYKFYECLNLGGALFLGETESLSGIPKIFEVLKYEKTLIYRKQVDMGGI